MYQSQDILWQNIWQKRDYPGWVWPNHTSPLNLSLEVRDQRSLCKPESNSIQETFFCWLWRWMGPCGKNLRVAFRSYWPKTSRLPVISLAKKVFIWEQQRIAIMGLQPQWATCKCLHNKGRTLLQREKGSWEGYISKESVAFHWLCSYQERRGDFHLLVRVC